MTCSVSELQEALKAAAENLSAFEESDELPTPAKIYLPMSHIRALRPHTLLVIGARGTGKTFWTQALKQESIRKMLKQDLPELANVRVIIAHSNRNEPADHPGPRQFSSLLEKYDAADIWRTIVWRALAKELEAAPPFPFDRRSLEEKNVADTAQSPEAVDRFLFEANKALAAVDTRFLLLIDALDRVAETWRDIDTLTTAALRTTLQLSTFSHLKSKIFLREDHFNRLTFTFPDASKLLATRVELSWKRAELHGLLWKRLCNAQGDDGKRLRELFEQHLPGVLVEKDGFWLFRQTVELTDDTLRPLFHALTGPFMGKDKRRGIPYIWTVGHLADARQQTSPRSFLVAIRRACDDSCENHPRAEYAIHHESIKIGVQKASEVRIDEMQEDNPWARDLLKLLKGMALPLSFEAVQDKWEEEYRQGPKALVDKYPLHTPPKFASLSWREVREQLDQLGFSMTLLDGRFNMPDLYRVGFGLGRRGGVKPLT